MSASPASKPVHSGTDAAKVARLTTRPPQRSASAWRRGTSRRISSAPTAGRKVTTVSRPIGGRLICLCGGPRDGPPHPPMLGAPRGTRGALRSSACSSLVVGGPEIAPQPLQAKGATPPSDSPGRCPERPGEPVALLDHPRAHRSSWGAPRSPPSLFKRRGLRPPRTPPADARSAPGNPWRSSIIRVLIDRRGGPRDGPPASSSEGGYAPLGLPRPTLGAPRGTHGAPRSCFQPSRTAARCHRHTPASSAHAPRLTIAATGPPPLGPWCSAPPET